jgi:tripartite ATP-independent transporter DctM subunit
VKPLYGYIYAGIVVLLLALGFLKILPLAPIMFASLIFLLLIGYPVAFTLGGIAMLFMLIGVLIQEPGMSFQALESMSFRIFGIIQNQNLLAIPFFTLLGTILDKSGLAEDMLETIGMLFGRTRGGIAYAVILVGAILGAITGVVAASVVSMALISIPIMLRYGYHKRLITGTIAASATLTQVIPPSLVLIVLADQLRVGGEISVGDMYKGAFIPGFMLTALYILYVFFITVFRPKDAPALPDEAITVRGWALAKRVATSAVPPLALIFIALGTTFVGLATPTEAGAMAVVGALILAAIKRTLNYKLLVEAIEGATKITALVCFILVGSNAFNLVFQLTGGGEWLEGFFTNLPGGQVGFLIVANLAVFFLAFFLEFFEISFIIVPLLAPVAVSLGIDLVWFGVMLCVNMQTSFMHPPFGFALFFLRGIAPPEISSGDIYWGAVPYVVLQLVGTAIVAAFPIISSPQLFDTVFTLQNVVIGSIAIVAFVGFIIWRGAFGLKPLEPNAS